MELEEGKTLQTKLELCKYKWRFTNTIGSNSYNAELLDESTCFANEGMAAQKRLGSKMLLQ